MHNDRKSGRRSLNEFAGQMVVYHESDVKICAKSLHILQCRFIKLLRVYIRYFCNKIQIKTVHQVMEYSDSVIIHKRYIKKLAHNIQFTLREVSIQQIKVLVDFIPAIAVAHTHDRPNRPRGYLFIALSEYGYFARTWRKTC